MLWLLVRQTSTHALLPIVISEVSTSTDRIEVELPNGLRVRLSVGSDATQWVPMIRALMAC